MFILLVEANILEYLKTNIIEKIKITGVNVQYLVTTNFLFEKNKENTIGNYFLFFLYS